MGNSNIATRRKLLEVRRGGTLFLGAAKFCVKYQVLRVVDYKFGLVAWRSIICQGPMGEVVFELTEGDMVRVWRNVKKLFKAISLDGAINFRGEKLELEERSHPSVLVDGERDGVISYQVYVGHGTNTNMVVCVEFWPEERVYLLENEISLSELVVV